MVLEELFECGRHSLTQIFSLLNYKFGFRIGKQILLLKSRLHFFY